MTEIKTNEPDIFQIVSDTWQSAWEVFAEVILILMPMIVISMLAAFVLSMVTLSQVFFSDNETTYSKYFQKLGLLFAFCVCGFIVGIFLKILGGTGGTKDNSSDDVIASIPVIISSFSAIVAVFFGETKISDDLSVRPLGTACTAFMMLLGYMYIARYFI